MVVRHVHLAAVAIRSVDVAQHLVVLLPAEEDAVQVGIIQPEERIPDGNGLGAHGALLAGGLTAMHRGAEPVRGLGQRLEVLHHAEDRPDRRAGPRPCGGRPGATVHATAAAGGLGARGDLPVCGDAISEAPTLGVNFALRSGGHPRRGAEGVLATGCAAELVLLPHGGAVEARRGCLRASTPIGQRQVAILGHDLQLRLEVEDKVAVPRKVLEVHESGVLGRHALREEPDVFLELALVLHLGHGAGELPPLRIRQAMRLFARALLHAVDLAIPGPGPAVPAAAVRRPLPARARARPRRRGGQREREEPALRRLVLGVALHTNALEAEGRFLRGGRLHLRHATGRLRGLLDGGPAPLELRLPVRLGHAGDVAEPLGACLLGRSGLHGACALDALEQHLGIALVVLHEQECLLASRAFMLLPANPWCQVRVQHDCRRCRGLGQMHPRRRRRPGLGLPGGLAWLLATLAPAFAAPGLLRLKPLGLPIRYTGLTIEGALYRRLRATTIATTFVLAAPLHLQVRPHTRSLHVAVERPHRKRRRARHGGPATRWSGARAAPELKLAAPRLLVRAPHGHPIVEARVAIEVVLHRVLALVHHNGQEGCDDGQHHWVPIRRQQERRGGRHRRRRPRRGRPAGGRRRLAREGRGGRHQRALLPAPGRLGSSSLLLRKWRRRCHFHIGDFAAAAALLGATPLLLGFRPAGAPAAEIRVAIVLIREGRRGADLAVAEGRRGGRRSWTRDALLHAAPGLLLLGPGIPGGSEVL
mmetsp:Transcript_584/g.1591  ORF Transcript_584/g.1591 Transcript_584/m.1591 type:complete len:761 (-) Transcript_584:604-2886(-)